MKGKASLRRLILSNFKLDVLLDISQAINENLSTEDLFQKFENLLRNDLNIGKVVVFSFNEKWDCVLSSGYNFEGQVFTDLEKFLLQYSEITNLTSVDHPIFNSFDVIIPVYHKNYPLAYILIGDIEEEREGVSPTIKHLHFIQTLANLIIVAVENKRLAQENLRQEAMKKELELASRMQAMLIPSSDALPKHDFFKVSAYYLPHSKVGGDYYDVIKLNDHEFGFCIADVSGKGVSAAILMSNFQANCRALFMSKTSLKEIVQDLNRIVMSNANGEKFITLFIAKYNWETKALQYINAGHNPPLLYYKSDSRIDYLETGCTGVGMLDVIPTIKEGLLLMEQGNKLVCYTDGLVETENDLNEEFGVGNMERIVKQTPTMDEIIHQLISQLDTFKGHNIYIDDITILGMEFLA